MGYGHYIGRVGALAVALGIGAAVATTPGIAWAQEDGAAGADTSAPAENDPGSPTGPPESPVGGGNEPDGNEPVGEEPDHTEESGESPSQTTQVVDGVIISSSGGAQTSGGESGTDEVDEQPIETEPPAPPTEQPTPPPPPSDPPSDPVGSPQVPPLEKGEGSDPEQPTGGTTQGASEPDGEQDGQQERVQDDSATVLLDATVDDTQFTAMRTTAFTSDINEPVNLVEEQPISSLARIPGTLIRLATDLLTAVLSPFLGIGGPEQPVDTPLLWALLGWVRRQFDNQTPTLSYDPEDPEQQYVDDDTIVIDPEFNDADGDTVTVVDYSDGQEGDVTYNTADGTFTYTPGATYDGSDTFAVTITDETGNPWHLHGLGGLFNSGGLHTRTYVLSVTEETATIDPRIIGQIPIGNASNGGELVFNEDRTLAYQIHTVKDADGHYRTEMHVIDAATGELIADRTIGRPGGTFGPLVFSEDRERAYLITVDTADPQGNTATTPTTTYVTVIEADTGRVLNEATPIEIVGTPNYTYTVDPGNPNGYRIDIVKFADDGRARLTTYNSLDEDSYQLGIVDFDALTGAPVSSDTITLDRLEGFQPNETQWGQIGERTYLFSSHYRPDNQQYEYVTTLVAVDAETGTFVDTPILENTADDYRFNPSGDRIFLTRYNADLASYEVTVLDADGTPVASEPTRLQYFGPDVRFTFSPDGSLVFLAENEYNSTVVVLDGQTGQQVGDPVEYLGWGERLKFNDDNTRAYIVSQTHYGNPGNVPYMTHVIAFDATTGQALNNGDPILDEPGQGQLLFSPDGTNAYLMLSEDVNEVRTSRLILINGDTAEVSNLTPLEFNGAARDLNFNEDGSLAFLATSDWEGDDWENTTQSKVTIIDTATFTRAQVPEIEFDGQVFTLQLREDGRMWVAGGTYDPTTFPSLYDVDLVFLDPETGQQFGDRISYRGDFREVLFNEDRTRAFIISNREVSDDLYETSFVTIDVTQGKLAGPEVTSDGWELGHPGPYPLGRAPTQPFLSDDGTLLFQLTRDSDFSKLYFAIVDASDGSLVGGDNLTFDGGGSYGPIPTPDASRVFLNIDGDLMLIDTGDNSVIGGVPLNIPGYVSRPVVLNSDGTRAYQLSSVTNPDGTTSTAFSVIDPEDGSLIGEPIELTGSTFTDVVLSEDGSMAFIKSYTQDAAGQRHWTLTVVDTELESASVV